MRIPYDNESPKRIFLSQWLFLLGLLLKQFYIFPSGSLQIGDIFLIFGCVFYFAVSLKGKLKIKSEEYALIIYIAFIVIINTIYTIAGHSSCFRSIIYYLYNLIIVLAFSSFLSCNNNDQFIRMINLVMKLSLIIQLILLLSGVGRWIYASRYGGSFNDPNQYSVFVFFSILMIYITDHFLKKNKWLFWCVLGTVLILPSTSTGTMLGVLVFWVGVYCDSVRRQKDIRIVLWGVLSIGVIAIFVLLYSGSIPVPNVLSNNGMYTRFMEKVTKVLSDSNAGALFSDRGWSRVLQYPHYFIYGAGEGGFSRFNTRLEIHSSIIGPLFYYGIVPFSFFLIWVFGKLKNTKYVFVYVALFTEAFFLINTRQPLYWMLIVLAGYKELGGGSRIAHTNKHIPSI